jgi:hypothetical protein
MALCSPHSSQPKNFDEIDSYLLEQTVEKLVRYRQQVGVTPEEMISLLDSGISIHDLPFPRNPQVRRSSRKVGDSP